MLTVNNVTKSFYKVKANDNINLNINDGEIAVLLGRNGAGKSTLIKCICSLLRFDGEIKICGFDNKCIEAKRLLGYIPEVPAVYDLLTVEEHLQFICRAYKIKDDGFSYELLRDFELYDIKNKLGKDLSKGMKQKLSICCALVHKPKVVIFDEPMVGLDPHSIKKLKDIFIKLKNEGVSVLISTHMIDSIEDYWDSAYILSSGRLAAHTSSGSGNESLEQLYFSVTEEEK